MKKLLMIIGVCIFSTLFTACNVRTPGNGEKVGQIVRLNKHGIINQTWEAQIIRGGFNGGSGVNGTAFDFTIEDENTVSLVREFMNNQTEVKIKYRTEGISSLFRSESGGDFLTRITTIGGETPSNNERKQAIKSKIQEVEKQLEELKNSLNTFN